MASRLRLASTTTRTDGKFRCSYPLVGDCGGVIGSLTLIPGMMKAFLTGLGRSKMDSRAIGDGCNCPVSGGKGGDAAHRVGNWVMSQAPGGVASAADGGCALGLLGSKTESILANS